MVDLRPCQPSTQGDLPKEEQATDNDFMSLKAQVGQIHTNILREKAVNKIWTEGQHHKTEIFSRYPVKQGPHNQITAVIMGPCGSGKTSLMNNICDASFKRTFGKEQQTRSVERVKVGCAGAFQVYDTPGTTSNQEVSLRAGLLRAALTYKPLNAVLINVSWNRRASELVKEMLSQLRPIRNYADHIIYLVSHSEQSIDINGKQKQLCDELQKIGLEQQVIFYSNTNCKPRELAQTLYKTCSNYDKVDIDISEDQFLQNFRVGSFDVLRQSQFHLVASDMRQLGQMCVRCLENLSATEETEAIIHDLTLYLKYELQEIAQEFIRQNKEEMMEADYYGSYFELQKLMLDANEKFATKARKYLRYSLIGDEPNKFSINIRDLLKQCPNCQQIWMLVENSCSTTFCGEPPKIKWDALEQKRKSFRYEFPRVGNKLTVQRKEIKRAKGEIREIANTKRVGCGAELKFHDLPRIPDIEAVLNELYSATDINELKATLKSDSNARSKMEAQNQEIKQTMSSL